MIRKKWFAQKEKKRNAAGLLALILMTALLTAGCGSSVAAQESATAAFSQEVTAGEEQGDEERGGQEQRAAETGREEQTGESSREAQSSAETGEKEQSAPETARGSEAEKDLPQDGVYTSREDVALYLHLYGKLPGNFITKKEARALGWEGGSLEPYAPGKCIGGDRFGNYEGTLPQADGRVYRECDIDTLYAQSRGAKRIVYSNDGLIYYTEDHYTTFELLYSAEDN